MANIVAEFEVSLTLNGNLNAALKVIADFLEERDKQMAAEPRAKHRSEVEYHDAMQLMERLHHHNLADFAVQKVSKSAEKLKLPKGIEAAVKGSPSEMDFTPRKQPTVFIEMAEDMQVPEELAVLRMEQRLKEMLGDAASIVILPPGMRAVSTDGPKFGVREHLEGEYAYEVWADNKADLLDIVAKLPRLHVLAEEAANDDVFDTIFGKIAGKIVGNGVCARCNNHPVHGPSNYCLECWGRFGETPAFTKEPVFIPKCGRCGVAATHFTQGVVDVGDWPGVEREAIPGLKYGWCEQHKPLDALPFVAADVPVTCTAEKADVQI
jgi:hypothetical protein